MASTAPRRVLDMFSYGGVHYDRVLLARLHELQDIVHMHVMIEMGAPLSLNVNYVHQHTVSQRWNSSEPCWRRWLPRIMRVQLDGAALFSRARKPYEAQRIMRTTGFATALAQALPPGSEEAWVLLSDIDEIPRASTLSSVLLTEEVRQTLLKGRVYALAGRSYYYNAACVSRHGSLEDTWIAGPKMLASESLRKSSWAKLRTYFIAVARERNEEILWNSSWHFGFLMTPDEQRTKLCLNVSPENRKICLHKAALNVIAHASRHCHDLWNRSSVPLVREERSSMLPAFVLEHYDEFALPSRSIHAEGGLCQLASSNHRRVAARQLTQSAPGMGRWTAPSISEPTIAGDRSSNASLLRHGDRPRHGMRAKQLEREVVESRNLARLRTKAKALCKERDAASAKDASCPGCVKLCRCCGPQHRSKTCVRPVGETCNGCRCDLGLISQGPSVLPPDQQLGDAVMLEMRALPRLSMTLLNVRANLPERTWRLNFWHGPSNHKTVNQTEQLTQAVARGTLRLRPYYQILKALGRPTSKGSQLDYRVHDNFMKSTTFWAHPSLDRPLIILFEPDVVLCPSRQWSARLQDFYGYAFVGAPWPNDNHWCYDLDECVGNSGLSLWRRDVMAAVLGARSLAEYGPLVADYFTTVGSLPRGRHPKWSAMQWRARYTGGPQFESFQRYRRGGQRRANLSRTAKPLLPQSMGQDLVFSHLLQALEYFGHLPVRAVAPEPLAELFSVESVYAANHTPVGFHQAYTYLSRPKLSELLRRCPSGRELVDAVAQEGRLDQRVTAKKRARLKTASLLAACHSMGVSGKSWAANCGAMDMPTLVKTVSNQTTSDGWHAAYRHEPNAPPPPSALPSVPPTPKRNAQDHGASGEARHSRSCLAA